MVKAMTLMEEARVRFLIDADTPQQVYVMGTWQRLSLVNAVWYGMNTGVPTLGTQDQIMVLWKD